MSGSLIDDNFLQRNEITNHEQARYFVQSMKGKEVKICVNMQDEAGYDFDHNDGQEIMHDRSVDSMEELFYNWVNTLPSLPDILNYIMNDFTNPDYCSDQNIVEDLFDKVDDLLGSTDLTGDDHTITLNILEDLVRDMYNYIAHTLIRCTIVKNEQVWEFINVVDAHMDLGKLYMTVRIYVDGLNDLDFMDERSDVGYVEIVDELKNLFVRCEEDKMRRKVYRGNRDGGLVGRLTS